MTCLVGLVDCGCVYIGGDSAASVEQAIEVRANRKVFRNGEYVVGFTGSFRVGQLLQYMALPEPDDDVMRHLVINIVPKLQTAAGKATDEIMIGYAGRLFKISSDYSVAEYTNYAAAGGGEPYALGRMHGSLGAPEQRILAALEAAQTHCTAVRAPFVVEVC